MNFEFKIWSFRSLWGRALPLLLVAVMFMLPVGCSSIPGKKVSLQVPLATAEKELPDEQLIDVSIKIFDPGKLSDNKKERRGLSPEIRQAESHFIPIHLKYTMQNCCYWGIVRVVPDEDNGTEVMVRGKIEYSDGESLSINVEVVDARNVVWFHKTYAETAKDPDRAQVEPGKQDIFQDLYNSITNDIIQYRNHLSTAEIKEIKRAAELRFAAAMAPDAFNSYLEKDPRDGTIHIQRLPAADDPMMARVLAIRSRDDMLVNLFNNYYDAYYQDLWKPYNDWRKFRTEEIREVRKINHQALTREILGAAAIIGAIAIAASGNSDTRGATSSLRDAMIMGGATGIYSGIQKRQEAKINQEAIEELGASFSSEAKPLVIEVEGETVRLTGTAKQQYVRWHKLLRRIYARETGLIPAEDAFRTEAPAQDPAAATIPSGGGQVINNNEDD